MQAAIKTKFGITATLKEGVAGIFEVSINDEVAYTNQETFRFPTNEEIFAKIEATKK